MMKTLLRAILVLLAPLLLFSACGSATTAHSTNPNTVTLSAASLSPTSITIKKGGTITFVDDPNNGALHILVVGTNGEQRSENGAPDFGGAAGERTNIGDTWTTGAWNAPGTYHVTCTVHPAMNLTVIVSS